MKNSNCLDMKRAKEAFDNWILLMAQELDKTRKMAEIKDANPDFSFDFEIYKIIKDSRNVSSELIYEYLNRHLVINEIDNINKEIMQIKQKQNDELVKPICEKKSKFVFLENNEDYNVSLVELNTLDKIMLLDISPFFIEFIIRSLNMQGCYIKIDNGGPLNEKYLPAILVIKNDLESKLEKDNLKYLANCSGINLASEIASEYAKAELIDEFYEQGRIDIKNNTITGSSNNLSMKLPFIFDSSVIQKKWRELDEKEKKLTHEQYLLEYYKLLMLFGNSIEKLYLEAPDNDKKYVIDAYRCYSLGMQCDINGRENEMIHFRTRSPIINEVIMQEKVLQKVD